MLLLITQWSIVGQNSVVNKPHLESPTLYLQNPEILLNNSKNVAIPLHFYSEEDTKKQLDLNKQEDLVLTSSNHSIQEGETRYYGIDTLDITPFTWTWIHLEVITKDNDSVDIKLRRPNTWLSTQGFLQVGDKDRINLEDLGVEGIAKVIGIYPNTFDTRFETYDKNSDKHYRPVIGVSKRYEASVFSYEFSNGDRIEATPGHIIWSESRNRWVAISALEINEEVLSPNQEFVQLLRKELLIPKKAVYSLEVYRDHNYFVGKSGILVHNSCIGVVLRRMFPDEAMFKKMVKKLTNSGALKEFVNPNTKKLTALGERFKNMRKVNKDQLIKDILDKPELAKALGKSPELLDSWKDLAKIGKRIKGVPQGHGLRNNIQFLKKYSALSPTKRTKLKAFLNKQQVPRGYKGQVNFTTKPRMIDGKSVAIKYDRYGFPDFMKFCPQPLKKFIFKSQRLAGDKKDFKMANEAIAKKFGFNGPYPKGQPFANATYKWTAGSQNFFVKQNGKWVKHTWHHHPDGKTLIPIKSVVHTASEGGFPHSGGDSLIREGLKGIFPSPNY